MRWNGYTIVSVNSGTNMPLEDIWGDTNGVAFIVGNRYGTNINIGNIYNVNNNQLMLFANTGLINTYQNSIWFSNSMAPYAAGSGVWRYNGTTWLDITPTGLYGYILSLRGTGENDIFGVGGLGCVYHYNGSTNYIYQNTRIDGDWQQLYVTSKRIVAIGEGSNIGFLLMGTRNGN